jgi:UDP:flavonoid glycosyltransferase YjiC (YdhE family)
VARFLFCVFGASGHIHPMLSTAKKLTKKGHEVGFLTAPSYRVLLEGMGFCYFEPQFWNANVIASKMPIQSRNFVRSLWETFKYASAISFPEGENQFKDLEFCKKIWNFDILVSSDMVLGSALFAEKTGCLWATFGAFLSCPVPGKDIPPWGFGLSLPENNYAKYLNIITAIIHKNILQLLSLGWEKIRKKYGLKPKNISLIEHVFSPYLYIVPSPLLFDYLRRDLPSHIYHVGPCPWEENIVLENWISPFENKNPIIYFTAGTVYNSLDFLKIVINAVKDKELNLFATLGKNNNEASLGALPKNVKVAQYVPQSLVLPKVQAVICNGGSGVIMGAILAQKPMVIVPMISDQPENARRCEKLGIALIVPLNKLNKDRISETIDHILNDSQLRKRSKNIGEQFAQFDGSNESVRLLEALYKNTII